MFGRFYALLASIVVALTRIAVAVEKTSVAVTTQGENIMSQLEDLVTALDNETNAVAARLDKLSADLQAAIDAGQAPKPETLAALSAISDRLKTLGADPVTPIPPTV